MTFDIYYNTITKDGRVATMSYFIAADSWEDAESKCPEHHWVDGRVVAVIDEVTGIRIDFDNLN